MERDRHKISQLYISLGDCYCTPRHSPFELASKPSHIPHGRGCFVLSYSLSSIWKQNMIYIPLWISKKNANPQQKAVDTHFSSSKIKTNTPNPTRSLTKYPKKNRILKDPAPHFSCRLPFWDGTHQKSAFQPGKWGYPCIYGWLV